MEKLVKALVCFALGIVCAGFAHKQYQEYTTEYETVVFHERVHAGDTFNGIVEQYYSDNEGVSWDEFQTKTKKRNKMLFYREDGSPRILQIGDIVCIECRIRVKK